MKREDKKKIIKMCDWLIRRYSHDIGFVHVVDRMKSIVRFSEDLDEESSAEEGDE